ncbi:MAG: hypothetical protein J5449_08315 [Oscillospiraceae bacterium]|nr:hypothetical protein [Oscillospiraceae bacterium]
MPAFAEKPPMITGQPRKDIENMRDYLFRMAQSLGEAANAPAEASALAVVSRSGNQIQRPGSGNAAQDVEAVRRNAEELKALIIKSARNLQSMIENGDSAVISYVDSKREVYDGYYLAKSEFGTFEESLEARIETSARGVVDSYAYASAIESIQDSIGLLQEYYTTIEGEIRRGIVLNPDTNQYEIGIVISQAVQFAGVVGDSDPNNPQDGNKYYYVDSGQTFGLYTSTGWQFWIGGVKRGWFSSQDSMLHVSNIVVEDKLQLGANWQITTTGGFGLQYIGG